MLIPSTRTVALRSIASILIAVFISGTAIYSYRHIQQAQQETLAKLFVVQEELSTTRQDLLGYTQFTDYLTQGKTALAEQMKFLAAKVDREYAQVQHIQKSTLGFNSDATILIRYAVEYSFGYDLRPDSFSISGNKDGITVTLGRPELVASPAVNILSHEIPSTGLLIDEKAAVIALQQQLFGLAKRHAVQIQRDEAVVALCEKKLAEFLHDFLAKQPNVKVVPAIKFAYSA
jgi:hypothetical protein